MNGRSGYGAQGEPATDHFLNLAVRCVSDETPDRPFLFLSLQAAGLELQSPAGRRACLARRWITKPSPSVTICAADSKPVELANNL